MVSFMSSEELLHVVLRKVSARKIAADLGVSPAIIYKWMEQGEGHRPNPFERSAAFMASAQDDRLIQWLCVQRGGVFVRNPPVKSLRTAQLMAESCAVTRDMGELLAVLSEAVADGKITKAEAVVIRSRWEQLKAETEALVRACEQGTFAAVTPVNRLAAGTAAAAATCRSRRLHSR